MNKNIDAWEAILVARARGDWSDLKSGRPGTPAATKQQIDHKEA